MKFYDYKVVVTLLIGFVLLLQVGAAARQRVYDAGASFKWGVDARALGMGGAFVAVADNYSAPYWNPASIVRRGFRLGGMHTDKFGLGIRYRSLSGIVPLGSGLALGGGLINSNITVETYDRYGRYAGVIEDNETLLLASIGVLLSPNISVGATVKRYSHWLGREFANGTGFDLGFLSSTDSFAVGAAMWDIGDTEMAWSTGAVDYVQRLLKVGIALRLADGGITLAADYGSDRVLHLGAEFRLRSLSLRGGVMRSLINPVSNLTVGAGVNFGSFNLDAALVHNSSLGNSFVISGELAFSTGSVLPPVLPMPGPPIRIPQAPPLTITGGKCIDTILNVLFIALGIQEIADEVGRAIDRYPPLKEMITDVAHYLERISGWDFETSWQLTVKFATLLKALTYTAFLNHLDQEVGEQVANKFKRALLLRAIPVVGWWYFAYRLTGTVVDHWPQLRMYCQVVEG